MNHLLFELSYKQLRNVIFIIAGLILIGLVALSRKSIGYRRTYFFINFLSVLFPVVSLYFSNELEKLGDVVILIIMALTFELPVFLLVYSIKNLNQKINIPQIFSIVNIILSAGLLIILFIGVMSAVSGGMIG
jgi:hypothetical protein